MAEKILWSGVLTSVQPRIRLNRSFDQRNHAYQGYVLRVRGSVGGEEREFLVGTGKGAHTRHEVKVGDTLSGEALPVANPQLETVELYKVSKLKLVARSSDEQAQPPPWHGVPPDLAVYRERGHRRLAAQTYDGTCTSCIWGCKMAVEMIIDQWKPSQRRYRTETFCYGPHSCSVYKSGPTRKVPGRRGMTYEEEDWVDKDATSHRSLDE